MPRALTAPSARTTSEVFSAQQTMNRALSIAGILLLSLAAGSCRDYKATEADGPEQPIAFYHSVHAGQNQMPCMYCHYSADRSPVASVPSVQLCVGCHVAGSGANGAIPAQASLTFPAASRDTMWNREALKLVDYWKRGASIPWVRIHKVPDHAHFPHNSHVNVGLTCQTCHGPVQDMKKVYQYSSLRMGWCVSCHRGETKLSEAEEASVRQRSSFVRRIATLRAQGNDVRGQLATYPNQRASVDCTVCHY